MADFKRIPIQKFSTANAEQSSESSYWMGYKVGLLIFVFLSKSVADISCINAPKQYADAVTKQLQQSLDTSL